MMQEYDVVVIGSGFGGAVSAMRLAQKGYKVAVIEEGMAWKNCEFPKSNWRVTKYLWAPVIRCFGIQRISLLRKLMILHGVGVGGGSLVYANTLMRPEEDIFRGPTWPKAVDWVKELWPHFEIAKKMLGVATNPYLAPNDLAMQTLGQKMGVAETFHATEVGIFFGKPEVEVPDPYFSGDGPTRTGCHFCGSCMIGCPNGAKNTLDKNYLYFAQKWGAKIFPGLRAEKIAPESDGSYSVATVSVRACCGNGGVTFKGKKVVFAAGALGTVKLLLKNRDIYKTLPKLSKKIGEDVRSNGESLLGASTFDQEQDFSKGVAIGAAIHPDPYTKIEGVRYPAGSDLLRFFAVPLAGDGNCIVRPLKMAWRFFTKPFNFLRLLFLRDWAKSTIILLVMQSVESKIKLTLGRPILNFFRLGLKGQRQQGDIPSYLPVAQDAAVKLADIIKGEPQNIFSEVFFQTPATAHILGGALIGGNAEEGAVDVNHELFGYKGLYVSDASIVPSNLAVNPSLTITALTERFAAHFPLNPAVGPSFKPPVIQFGAKE
ncbi:MAG: GMC family oxidoreductase [Bdellovibrio sp.]|nr:GMC family oxidoreductase [Bdellovibrio sp.]